MDDEYQAHTKQVAITLKQKVRNSSQVELLTKSENVSLGGRHFQLVLQVPLRLGGKARLSLNCSYVTVLELSASVPLRPRGNIVDSFSLCVLEAFNE